jgi:hypothetical protein
VDEHRRREPAVLDIDHGGDIALPDRLELLSREVLEALHHLCRPGVEPGSRVTDPELNIGMDVGEVDTAFTIRWCCPVEITIGS